MAPGDSQLSSSYRHPPSFKLQRIVVTNQSGVLSLYVSATTCARKAMKILNHTEPRQNRTTPFTFEPMPARARKWRHLAFLLLGITAFVIHSAADEPRSLIKQATVNAHGAKFKLRYQTIGEGPEAVVFIHGAMSDSSAWDKQIPALKDNYRLILFDLPGHGKSDRPQVVYNGDLFVQALDAIMKEADVKRATLVGHSFGTIVARHYYRRHPDRVRGLVFIDGPLRSWAPNRIASEAIIAPFRGPNYFAAIDTFVHRFSAQADEKNRAESIKRWRNTPQGVIIRMLDLGLNPEADPSLWEPDEIKAPVLALYTNMSYVPENNEAYLKSFAPKAKYETWEGVGHDMVSEKPDRFNATLGGFLRQIGTPKRK
jgi:pimeloyl-ACP methyl ester carboxylesterase